MYKRIGFVKCVKTLFYFVGFVNYMLLLQLMMLCHGKLLGLGMCCNDCRWMSGYGMFGAL